MSSPFETGDTMRAVFGVLLRYVFADGTELHLHLHELFSPEIHRLLEIAIQIHGPARIRMPRPGLVDL